jgi:hypothetical protein
MALLGSLYLGGTEGSPDSGTVFNSGVGFFLSSKSKENALFFFEDDRWEVEVCQGQKSIIARCQEPLTMEKILSTGLELCQRALDLMSVSGQDNLQIEKPGESHVLVFKSGDKIILREVSISDFSVSLEATATVLDSDGNVKPQPLEQQPDWISAFRYYRLSQVNTDLFESYRNLYLSFESLLHEICPKNNKENEGDWLERALENVSEKVDLSRLVPSRIRNPIKYIINTQYTNVRCKLFHAKGERAILPHQNLNPTFVIESHRRLTRLWHEIATAYMDIQYRGGGGLTAYGFNLAMNNMFLNNNITFGITADLTPFDKADTEISPLGLPVFGCMESKYQGEYSPGIALLTGDMEGKNLDNIKLIHRIGVLLDGHLAIVSFIPDGLKPGGVDRLESYQSIRLRNKGA